MRSAPITPELRSVKTTLIYAGIAGRGFNSLSQGMDAGWVAHGLASISAAAKAQGFQVDLIDLRALRDWDHFREEFTRRDPDVVGIGMMSVDYNPTRQALEIIKAIKPETVTVVGGPHVTIALDDSLRMPNVDYFITHEAEVTFPKLLRAIELGNPPAEKVIHGETPDLDAIPFADRDLFLDEWRRWGYTLDSPEVPFVKELPAPFLTIIAGRGCVYNCSFCKPGEDYIFGKGVRRRSVENVIDELKLLRDKYHFASFMFHDDCLTEDRRLGGRVCAPLPGGGLYPALLLPIPRRHHCPAHRHGGEDGRRGAAGLLSSALRVATTGCSTFCAREPRPNATWKRPGSAAATAWPSGPTICWASPPRPETR